MRYTVNVCECKYKFLNLIDRAGANHRTVKALKLYAKDLKCDFFTGAKKCPKCGREIGSVVEQSLSVNSVNDAESADRAAKETFEFLAK